MTGFDVGAYVPRVLLARSPDSPRHWRTDGTMIFVDISGFTKLSDQLARRGREGAEDLVSTLVRIFTVLLSASDDGGDLIKFGGDALLVSYTGPSHERRACHAAHMMQRVMRVIGNVQLTGAKARLRMSVGVHSGTFDYLLPGAGHQDLVVMGPAVTRVLELEAAADAGEILVSPTTAAALPTSCLGAVKGPGRLLRRIAPVPSVGSQILFRTQDDEQVWQFMPTVFRDRPDLLAASSDHRRAAMAFVYVDGLDEAVVADPVGTLSKMDRLAAEVAAAVEETGISVLDTDVGKDGYKYFLAAGAPAALEDPEGRMLRALLRIVNADTGLRVRAGCAAGRVFAGTVGAPFRCSYAAMGDTTNLSARLTAKAEPGEVLAHEPLLDRSATEFGVGETRHVELKGKPNPEPVVAVHEVLGLRARRTSDVAFLGRDQELGALGEAFAGLADGDGAVVEIVGEAGLGKTRLAEAALSIQRLEVITVPCDPYGALVPYQTLRTLLRPLLGIGDGTSPELAGKTLKEYAEREAPAVLPLLPLLAPAVGAEVPATEFVDEIDERFRAPLLHDAVTDLLQALLPNPVGLIFDDSQWVDETSAEALAAAFANLAGRPWAVVLTRRQGDDGLHGGDELPTTTVHLAPMNAEEAVGLVRQLQGLVRPEQLDAIIARGGGNPYFLMQLAATAEGTGVVELPDTVEELVGARIDRLDAEERELLRRAAVLGSRFHPDLYVAATGDESMVGQTSQALADFLGLAADGHVAFQREIYREVAYSQLTFRSRRQLHQRAAAAIEEHPQLAGEARLSMLSLHYDRAGQWDQAWVASRAAGDQARRASANDEAVEFYRRALAAARRAQPPRDDVLEVAEAMGDVAHVAGRFAEAAQAYRQSLRTRSDPEDRVRLELKMSRVMVQDGQFPAATRAFRAARKQAALVPAQVRRLVAGEIDVAESASEYYQGNNVAARDLADRAWTAAQGLPENERTQRLRARASFMFDTAAGLADGPSGLRFHDLPLKIYRELGDHYYAGIACNNLAMQAFNEGRWDDAVALQLEGQELCQRAGDRMSATFIGVNRAEVVGFQGHRDQAEDLLASALHTFRGMRLQVGIAATSVILARVLLRFGDVERARPVLAEARAISESLGSTELEDCDVLDLEALLLSGNLAQVVTGADTLLARQPALTPLHKARVRHLLGLALGRSGDFAQARVQLEASLLLARQMEADYEVALALQALGELGGPDAEFRLEDAQDLFEKLGVTQPV